MTVKQEAKSYTFGEFIREEIRRREMSEREFAAYIGVHHSTVARWVRNEIKEPTVALIDRLCDKLGQDRETLLLLISGKIDGRTTNALRVRVVANRIEHASKRQRDLIDSILGNADLK